MKLGIDPTAPDIHLGHTVVLQKLREFQDLGHRVVLIVGDYTARVGDPSGRSDTRPVLTRRGDRGQRAHLPATRRFKVLDDDPERYEVRRNGEWLDMRDGGAVPRSRARRPSRSCSSATTSPSATRRGAPISMLELLYPLLQGYDSVAVRLRRRARRHRPEVQPAARARRPARLRPARAGGADDADPARASTASEKMSKSLGNHIGVTEPPEEMFGKTMRLPDDGDGRRGTSCCAVERAADGRRAARRQARAGARDRRALPRRGRRRGGRGALRPRAHRARAAGGDRGRRRRRRRRPGPPAGRARRRFGVSRSEARRLLGQGGVRVDGEPLGADELDVAGERAGRRASLQVGKRRFRRVARRAERACRRAGVASAAVARPVESAPRKRAAVPRPATTALY